ncbi:ribonuclease H-like domain-containing protein [Butyrivibrio sp. WCD3002]|uniref:ribonuclease H-like domain-containing protein n=1 Tax=Butyrivibrio sp. WCD3002 TaxID=1280676 RepID=UPI0003F733BA|nr:ribonuclease H-like domain-containing protein [Butyrivibrio sp. WCD3002]
MKIIDELINQEPGYPLERICNDKKDILFFDIETTGLSPKTSSLYLIGCAYYGDDGWHLRQFFANEKNEEFEVIKTFMGFARDYKILIHFNGNRFDLPFIKFKCDKANMTDVLENMESIDMYKRISPYKNVLGIPDCKQKTIELFLGIDRIDEYSGGELIEVYTDYLTNPTEKAYNLLMQHNADDVRGMFALLPSLYYYDLFTALCEQNVILFNTEAAEFPQIRSGFLMDEGSDNEDPDAVIDLPIRATKVQANYYNDYEGKTREEIIMKVSLPDYLPSSVGGSADGCYFKAEGSSATIRMPLLEKELKYFYDNYKDYYYLPAEDQALHKSVAQFVEKTHREQAKASNCYTRKPGQYLVQWDAVFSPVFKESYEDKKLYFELTDELKQSRSAMSLYALHVMAHIIESC